MSARARLKLSLKVMVGTPPDGPSDAELDAIIRDIKEIRKTRTPTREDWIRITHNHVPLAGRYRYAGEDLSDLNMLLSQILSSPTPGSGGSEKK